MDNRDTNMKSASTSGGLMKNKRLLMYAAVVIVIIVVAAALILTASSGSSGAKLESYDNLPVPASLISELNVPNNISSAIGIGAVNPKLAQQTGAANEMTKDGKPLVLYIGAEYCPYCGAQRWAMLIALDRFGNLTGVRYMTSSHTDAYADTPTFSFANATYSSPYISFVAVETTTNKEVNGTYPILQVPNNTENVTFGAYNQGGSIPFFDIANKTVIIGATYTPHILQGMNWSQVANELSDASTAQAQGIVGSANLLTAEICMADNEQPQSVCGQSYIQSIETQAAA